MGVGVGLPQHLALSLDGTLHFEFPEAASICSTSDRGMCVFDYSTVLLALHIP